MATFSERVGVGGIRGTIQVSELDVQTRNRIANKLRTFVHTHRQGSTCIFDSDVKDWIDRILKQPVSKYSALRVSEAVEAVILSGEWHIVLSTVEHFTLSRSTGVYGVAKQDAAKLQNSWNLLFEEEAVGYRFHNGLLSRIVEPDQADAIHHASASPTISPGARRHIGLALNMLRPGEGSMVDVVGVVREAINACEAQARYSLADDRVTLGAAAKKIATTRNTHPAFSEGIAKLYGWASDEAGIRHASDGKHVQLTVEDAIFLLSISSAFVTWASSFRNT